MECKRHVCKNKVRSCKNYKRNITVKTTRHRNIVKIIIKVNVRPVIQLVYMKKQTLTKRRRKDEKVSKQLMKLEMKLYLFI